MLYTSQEISLTPSGKAVQKDGKWHTLGKESLLELQSNSDCFHGGWHYINIEIKSNPEGFSPVLISEYNNVKEIITLPFFKGKYNGFIKLPANISRLFFIASPWPLNFEIIDFRLRRIGATLFLINKHLLFFKYIFSRRILKRIIDIFFHSREGFLFHAKETCKLFINQGVDGLRNGLDTYSYNMYQKPTLPDKYWYLYYQHKKDYYKQLLSASEELTTFIPESISFANQIKQPSSSIDDADYVVLVSENTVLEPTALARIAQAGAQTHADLIYGDEIFTVNHEDWEIVTRPAFSLDLFFYYPFLGSVVAVKKAIYQDLYPDRNIKNPSPDILCHLLKHCQTVTHIPDILCKTYKIQQFDPEILSSSVTSYLKYKKIDAVVDGNDNIGNDVRYRINKKWKATIIIPTKNNVDILKRCIQSIEETCPSETYDLIVVDNGSDDKATLTYLQLLKRKQHTVIPYDKEFNYSEINNIAVDASPKENEYLVLMNNDIEVLTTDWLTRMIENINRREVGIITPLLIYPDKKVQHAGVVLGYCGGIANHISKYEPTYSDNSGNTRSPGYGNYLTAIRDYSAVTAACMAIRRSVFDQLNGFNEDFRVGLNDIDLCIRATQLGLKVLYDGKIVMIHHESYSRSNNNKDYFHPEDNELFKKIYAAQLQNSDIWFNPLLSTEHFKHTPAEGLTAKTNLDLRTIKLN